MAEDFRCFLIMAGVALTTGTIISKATKMPVIILPAFRKLSEYRPDARLPRNARMITHATIQMMSNHLKNPMADLAR